MFFDVFAGSSKPRIDTPPVDTLNTLMLEWSGTAMARKQTPKSTTSSAGWLRSDVSWALGANFLLIAAYIVTTIIFDSWNLIPHDAVEQRWTAAGMLLALNAVVWFAARSIRTRGDVVYRAALYTLVIADIIFASYNIFWERGMASTSVVLFAVPIIMAAIARSRTALLTATVLAVAGYSTAAVRYFNQHYGEGFRVQLYGYVFFYSALMFVLAALLAILIRPNRSG